MQSKTNHINKSDIRFAPTFFSLLVRTANAKEFKTLCV